MTLAGKRIVVTRAVHQAAEQADLLKEHGAEPVLYPCIAIVPPEDCAPLDAALRDADSYEWLVLTSTNTVLMLRQRLDELRISLPITLQVAAIGPATATTARDLLGIETSLIPEKYVAESLADALQPRAGTRILLPQADLARPVLAQSLIAAGAAVKAIDAYQTVIGSGGANIPAMLAKREIDAITFTSASTAQNFAVRLINEGGDLADLDGVCIAAIGPVTADAIREVGLNVNVMPEQHTIEGLIAALKTYFTKG